MYWLYLILTFILSLLITPIIRKIMRGFGVVDKSVVGGRKIHKESIPLGGGVAIFVSFFLVVFGFLFFGEVFGNEILPRHIFALFIGGLLLMIGGWIDDKYNVSAAYQIWFPIFAAVTIILAGVGLGVVTSPFGGTTDLDAILLIDNILTLADIVVFFWLMAMMFTTKLLDGLDGLVTGLVTIGALMIFFLSLQDQWFQPEVAMMSVVFAGACLGFLVWNWNPAKIFLGQGGSLFTGFVLGVLAIISGGKIATTLLVMGIPMLDMVRVVIRRFQKKKSVFVGDNEHLHFKLLDSGLSQRQAVFFLYLISFLFGITTLFLQSSEKMIALLFLFILMLLIGFWFSFKDR